MVRCMRPLTLCYWRCFEADIVHRLSLEHASELAQHLVSCSTAAALLARLLFVCTVASAKWLEERVELPSQLLDLLRVRL